MSSSNRNRCSSLSADDMLKEFPEVPNFSSSPLSSPASVPGSSHCRTSLSSSKSNPQETPSPSQALTTIPRTVSFPVLPCVLPPSHHRKVHNPVGRDKPKATQADDTSTGRRRSSAQRPREYRRGKSGTSHASEYRAEPLCPPPILPVYRYTARTGTALAGPPRCKPELSFFPQQTVLPQLCIAFPRSCHISPAGLFPLSRVSLISKAVFFSSLARSFSSKASALSLSACDNSSLPHILLCSLQDPVQFLHILPRQRPLLYHRI